MTDAGRGQIGPIYQNPNDEFACELCRRSSESQSIKIFREKGRKSRENRNFHRQRAVSYPTQSYKSSSR